MDSEQVSFVALETEKECRLVWGIILEEPGLGRRPLGILELGGLEKEKHAERWKNNGEPLHLSHNLVYLCTCWKFWHIHFYIFPLLLLDWKRFWSWGWEKQGTFKHPQMWGEECLIVRVERVSWLKIGWRSTEHSLHLRKKTMAIYLN